MALKKKLKKLTVISLIAIMTAVNLVGCSSSNDSTGASSDTKIAAQVQTKLTNAKLDGEEVSVDGTKLTTVVHFTPAPAGHGNPSIEGGPDWSMQPLIYDYLCDYSSQPENKFTPQLLESYNWENKKLTMKLREGLKFSDGSEITADDLLTNIYVDMSNNQTLYYAKSITKVDDLTVEIEYTQDSELIMTYMLRTPLMYSNEEYGTWADEYKDVFENKRKLNDDGNYEMTEEGNDKFNQITVDKNNHLPNLMDIKVSGAYVPTNMTSSEVTFKKNPHYRKDLKIETIVGIRPTSTESSAIAIQNKDYDLEGQGLSNDLALKVAQNNTDTLRQMVVPEFSQIGFCFNVNGYPTDKLEVRKAIAHVIDTPQIAPATEPGMTVGDEYAMGLPPSIRNKYLSEEDLSTFEKYNLDLDEATKLLESIGWKKEGNMWVDEKGESPEILITGVSEYPAYVVMAEAATNMLKEFGLNATFSPKEASAYNEYAVSGEANMVIDGFSSASGTQHPYEAYNGIWWYGKRMNLKFPSSGDLIWKDEVTGEEFNYSKSLYNLLVASNKEDISKETKEIGKFLNDNMWYMPVVEKYYVYRIHNDKLSLAEGKTGEEMSDYYWSGTTSYILSKMLRDLEVNYVK